MNKIYRIQMNGESPDGTQRADFCIEQHGEDKNEAEDAAIRFAEKEGYSFFKVTGVSAVN